MCASVTFHLQTLLMNKNETIEEQYYSGWRS